MLDRKTKLAGISFELMTALIWGLAFVAQRKATDSLSAIAVNGLRFALASAFLFVFSIVLDFIFKKQGKEIIPWTKETILGGALLGAILFVGNNLQQLGLEGTSAGKAGFISALYIVFVPIFSLLARKKPKANCWYAVLIAIFGFYLISINEALTISKGDLMVFLCSLIFAFHIIYTDIYAKNTDPVKLTFMQMFIGGIISIPAMAIKGFPTSQAIGENLVPILYIGLCSSGIGFTFQTIGQKKVESSIASLIMSLESVFALIFGIIILKEPMTAKELIGCLLVFIGIFVAQLDSPSKFVKFNKSKLFVNN